MRPFRRYRVELRRVGREVRVGPWRLGFGAAGRGDRWFQ
jgi:hypothetical protein